MIVARLCTISLCGIFGCSFPWALIPQVRQAASFVAQAVSAGTPEKEEKEQRRMSLWGSQKRPKDKRLGRRWTSGFDSLEDGVSGRRSGDCIVH